MPLVLLALGRLVLLLASSPARGLSARLLASQPAGTLATARLAARTYLPGPLQLLDAWPRRLAL